ncbi:hypothetical protein MY10362_002957 [Beauveria mimosiformis]
MTDTASETTAAVSPAQIAALCVSIFAIIVFTSISIYLYGRRKGCEAVHGHSHNHHHHCPPHITRILDTRPRNPPTSGQGSATRGGRFTRLREAFGIKFAAAAEAVAAKEGSSSSAAAAAETGKAARMRATTPLQIGIHTGTDNPYSGTEEFQAAVHNLLSYRPGELQEWYHESDDGDDDDDDNNYGNTHGESRPEQREGSYSATDPCSSPLPAYAEVAEPRRFSWQGQESDYRPEKRE